MCYQEKRFNLHSFSTRRSSDLSGTFHARHVPAARRVVPPRVRERQSRRLQHIRELAHVARGTRHAARGTWHVARRDRKSTRLNSSHLVISYAVFCLKKKIHNNQ